MDYDAWKTGWFHSDSQHDCKDCLSHEQKLDECRNLVEEVISQLSSEKALNVSLLENCLDELCYLLKAEQSKKDLKIQRKETSHPYRKWLELSVSQ